MRICFTQIDLPSAGDHRLIRSPKPQLFQTTLQWFRTLFTQIRVKNMRAYNSCRRGLRSEDTDGNEIVSSSKSMFFESLSWLIQLSTSSNVGDLYWSWILYNNNIQVQRENEYFAMAYLRSPQKVKLGIFTSLSCSNSKEMYKIAWSSSVIYNPPRTSIPGWLRVARLPFGKK